MHMVAPKVDQTIPLDFFSIIPYASENDLMTLRLISPKLEGKAIFVDKASADIPLNQQLLAQKDTYIYISVKLVKAQAPREKQF